MGVVAPPSPTLLRAADLLDEGVGHLLKARDQLSSDFVKFESSHDALNLLYHSLRHIEAVVELVRKDVVLRPAAITAARAALESSVRGLWLVDCDEPFEREGRWLGFIDEEVFSRKRAARHFGQHGHTEASTENQVEADELENYRNAVAQLLPKAYAPRRLPKFDAMLAETKTNVNYAIYVIGSQYTHGTSWALSAFRQGLGTQRRLNELKDSVSWVLPVAICAAIVRDTGCRLLYRLGVPHGQALPRTFSGRLERAVSRISNE